MRVVGSVQRCSLLLAAYVVVEVGVLIVEPILLWENTAADLVCVCVVITCLIRGRIVIIIVVVVVVVVIVVDVAL